MFVSSYLLSEGRIIIQVFEGDLPLHQFPEQKLVEITCLGKKTRMLSSEGKTVVNFLRGSRLLPSEISSKISASDSPLQNIRVRLSALRSPLQILRFRFSA